MKNLPGIFLREIFIYCPNCRKRAILKAPESLKGPSLERETKLAHSKKEIRGSTNLIPPKVAVIVLRNQLKYIKEKEPTWKTIIFRRIHELAIFI